MTYEEFKERAKIKKISITLDDFISAAAKVMSDFDEQVDNGLSLSTTIAFMAFQTELAKELFENEPTAEEISQGYAEGSEDE